MNMKKILSIIVLLLCVCFYTNAQYLKYLTIYDSLKLKKNTQGTSATWLLGKDTVTGFVKMINPNVFSHSTDILWHRISTSSNYIAPVSGKYIASATLYSADSVQILYLDKTNTNIYIGEGAGTTNSSSGCIGIGYQTGNGGMGNYQINLGFQCGTSGTGTNAINIGYRAGYFSSGNAHGINIGTLSGQITGANYSICIGDSAGMGNVGDSSIFIGHGAGKRGTPTFSNALGRSFYIGRGDTNHVYMFGQMPNGVGKNGYLRLNGSLYINGAFNYGVDGQSTDSYIIAIPGVTQYTIGMVIVFKANTANTGACSVNINGIGTVTLKIKHDQDPGNNYIESGSMIIAVYDGTYFQIQTPTAN
jgi:hypothetical protein